MKSFLKNCPHHEHAHFTILQEGMIESQGIILKRLNKRIRNKTIVIEYYKCYNSYTRNKNCGPCKFSGKLIYQLNSKPNNLEILKRHSLFCINNEGNKQYISKTKNKFLKKLKKQKLNVISFEHDVYKENTPIVNISVQVHSEDNNIEL